MKRLPTIRRRDLTLSRKMGLLREMYDACADSPLRQRIIDRALRPLEEMHQNEVNKHNARIWSDLVMAREKMKASEIVIHSN